MSAVNVIFIGGIVYISFTSDLFIIPSFPSVKLLVSAWTQWEFLFQAYISLSKCMERKEGQGNKNASNWTNCQYQHISGQDLPLFLFFFFLTAFLWTIKLVGIRGLEKTICWTDINLRTEPCPLVLVYSVYLMIWPAAHKNNWSPHCPVPPPRSLETSE